jgi:hypothetical protein
MSITSIRHQGQRRAALVLAIVALLIAGAAGGRVGAAQDPSCGVADRGPIAYGGSAPGRIDTCVTEERWTFEGERGQVVVITMVRPQPPTLSSYALDPLLRLYASGETGFTRLVAENDDGGVGVDSRIETRLAATGRYQIAARGLERPNAARSDRTNR